MATLIGPVPPGLTFHPLVGGTMPDTPPRPSAPAQRAHDSATETIKAARKPGPDAPVLDRETQDHIGQQLRAMYEQLLEEPVPGHLLMLMARLERQNRKQSNEC